MIIKEMFYIPIKLKPEFARASMTTSEVSNQWRMNKPLRQKRGMNIKYAIHQ
jgi:hypothetical protein